MLVAGKVDVLRAASKHDSQTDPVGRHVQELHQLEKQVCRYVLPQAVVGGLALGGPAKTSTLSGRAR